MSLVYLNIVLGERKDNVRIGAPSQWIDSTVFAYHLPIVIFLAEAEDNTIIHIKTSKLVLKVNNK